MSPLESFTKWLKLKIYQFEVTYSLYMLTPAEKAVCYLVLSFFISLTLTATILYLPHHLAFMTERAWFYMNGDAADAAAFADAIKDVGARSLAAAGASTAAAASTTKTAGEILREL